MRSFKKCGHCKQDKPLDGFYKNRSMADGLQHMCKECSKEQTKASQATGKHQEWMRRSRAKVKADPAKYAKAQEYSARKKATRRADPVKAAHDREVARKSGRRNYQANKERYYCNNTRRIARLLGNGGSHSVESWRQLQALFGAKCLCCGSTERLHKDHVIPLSRGGTDNIENIQPLCRLCNKSKFTRDTDYRSRDKVVLAELNEVGRLLFAGFCANEAPVELRKHKPASRYTGVGYSPKNERSVKVWRARIQVDGWLLSLGRFETEEAAAVAYNDAAKAYLGPNACLNEVGSHARIG